MFISLLVILLGTAAVSAAPTENEELRESGGDDVFEGDMILSEAQKKMAEKYVILTDAQQAEPDKEEKQEEDDSTEGGPLVETGASFSAYGSKWPGNKLYYDLSELGWWSPFLKRKIRNALKDLQNKIGNCVKFIEKDSGPRVEVHSHSKDGCQSTVGYLGITEMNNKLNLASNCQKKGVIQHEFLHALGFFHSQSRSDRDKYITVMEDNIKTNFLPNFHKYSPVMIKHFGLPYDYSSVMHYPTYAFSWNDGKTIVTKDATKQGLIGQREGLSEGDIKMIRKAYNCA